MKRVVTVRSTRNYEIELDLTDSSVGTVGLAPRIVGRTGVSGAHRHPEFFARVAVNEAAGTIV